MPEYHRNTEEMDVLLEKIDLSQPAPTEEPMRQYYFIKKAKSTYDDCALWLYDAGAGSCRETEKEL